MGVYATPSWLFANLPLLWGQFTVQSQQGHLDKSSHGLANPAIAASKPMVCFLDVCEVRNSYAFVASVLIVVQDLIQICG